MANTILANLIKSNILAFVAANSPNALIFTGKHAKKADVRALKLMKQLEDEDSENLYFAFVNDFDTPKNYFSNIISTMAKQYEGVVKDVDPNRYMRISSPKKYLNNWNGLPTFNEFLTDLDDDLSKLGLNVKLVIYLDPENIISEQEFVESVRDVITALPTNVKFVIVEVNGILSTQIGRSKFAKFMKFPFDKIELIEFMKSVLLKEQNLDVKTRIDLTGAIATTHFSNSSWNEALQYYEEALELARRYKMKRDEALLLCSIASVYQVRGQKDAALKFYGMSLNIALLVPDSYLLIQNLNSIAVIHLSENRFEEAIDYKSKAKDEAERIGDYGALASLYGELGVIEYKMGTTSKALDLFKRAVDITRQNKNLFEEAKQLKNMGATFQKMGKHERSKEILSNAEQIEKRIGTTVMSDFELDPTLKI